MALIANAHPQPNGKKHYLTLGIKNENFTSIVNARCWGVLFGPRACLHIDMTILILLWRWDNMGKLRRLKNTILCCNNLNLFVYKGKNKFYIWLKRPNNLNGIIHYPCHVAKMNGVFSHMLLQQSTPCSCYIRNEFDWFQK